MTIPPYATYRDVINSKIVENSSKKGYRAQLAKAAKCQQSHLSAVLKGQVQLTLDQASGLADFWNLGERESEYFLLLLSYERAGSVSLKKRLKNKLNLLDRSGFKDSDPVVTEIPMQVNHALRYYSSWYWSAIHVAVSMPQYRDASSLAKRFSLPIELVEQVLEGLEQMGLIYKEKRKWYCSQKNIALMQSPQILGQHHMGMRQRANFSLGTKGILGAHYSAMLAIPASRATAFMADVSRLIKTVQEMGNNGDPGAKGEVYGFCVDFFIA